jgi:hypothetical protein
MGLSAKEYKEAVNELAFRYFAKPVILAVSMIVIGGILNTLNENYFGNLPYVTLITPILVILALGSYFASVVFKVNPANPVFEYVQKTSNQLKNIHRRHPDRYLYLDIKRIEQLSAFYNKSDGILRSRTNSIGGIAGVSVPLANASIGANESLDYEILPERLFEGIEKYLRDGEYARFARGELPKAAVLGWVQGNLTLLGTGRTTTGAEEPIMVIQIPHVSDDNPIIHWLPVYLSPRLQPYLHLSKELNVPIEIFGELSESDEGITLSPVVIIDASKQLPYDSD